MTMLPINSDEAVRAYIKAKDAAGIWATHKRAIEDDDFAVTQDRFLRLRTEMIMAGEIKDRGRKNDSRRKDFAAHKHGGTKHDPKPEPKKAEAERWQPCWATDANQDLVDEVRKALAREQRRGTPSDISVPTKCKHGKPPARNSKNLRAGRTFSTPVDHAAGGSYGPNSGKI